MLSHSGELPLSAVWPVSASRSVKLWWLVGWVAERYFGLRIFSICNGLLGEQPLPKSSIYRWLWHRLAALPRLSLWSSHSRLVPLAINRRSLPDHLAASSFSILVPSVAFTHLDRVVSKRCSVGSAFGLTGDTILAPQEDAVLVFTWF